MEYQVLVNDLEIDFGGIAETKNIYVDAGVATLVFDIIITPGYGTEISVMGHNAERYKVTEGGMEVPDSETSSPEDSPYSASIFNRVIISPNFLRLKTNGAGPAKIRLRGNFNG